MPSLFPALSPESVRRLLLFAFVLAIPLVCVAVPVIRRSLNTLFKQMSGCRDAKKLANRSPDLVAGTVIRRVNMLMGRAEWDIQLWLKRSRKQSGYLSDHYTNARKSYQDALEELERAEADERAEAASGAARPFKAPRFAFNPSFYWPIQALLGIGDFVLTYLALQLFSLPPILLYPTAFIYGLIGVVLGHVTGQGFYASQLRHAAASSIGCIAYCAVLGTMRFAYLSDIRHGHVTVTDAISIWGLPFVLVGTSVLLGSNLRRLTVLEQARVHESLARRRWDRAFQRGKDAADALTAKMRQRVVRALELIDAYHRGFSLCWKGDPLKFADPPALVVDAILWPPVLPDSHSLWQERPHPPSVTREPPR